MDLGYCLGSSLVHLSFPTTHSNQKRTCLYISSQFKNPPQTPITVIQLVLLTLYLAMLGFFICFCVLRAVFPWILRLGEYATHEANKKARMCAISGVLAFWFICVLCVVGLPLIPALGGIAARNIK